MTHSMNKPPYKMLHASTFQASVDFLIDLALTPPPCPDVVRSVGRDLILN